MSHEAFLRAILEEPEDDTHRLVYADYLEEHGDPDRAEFIRVQCELARMGEDEEHRFDLEARADMLLSEHRRKWLGPLNVLPAPSRFRRGFVEHICATADDFLHH